MRSGQPCNRDPFGHESLVDFAPPLLRWPPPLTPRPHFANWKDAVRLFRQTHGAWGGLTSAKFLPHSDLLLFPSLASLMARPLGPIFPRTAGAGSTVLYQVMSQ